MAPLLSHMLAASDIAHSLPHLRFAARLYPATAGALEPLLLHVPDHNQLPGEGAAGGAPSSVSFPPISPPATAGSTAPEELSLPLLSSPVAVLLTDAKCPAAAAPGSAEASLGAGSAQPVGAANTATAPPQSRASLFLSGVALLLSIPALVGA
jgi:hypothetical protein